MEYRTVEKIDIAVALDGLLEDTAASFLERCDLIEVMFGDEVKYIKVDSSTNDHFVAIWDVYGKEMVIEIIAERSYVVREQS